MNDKQQTPTQRMIAAILRKTDKHTKHELTRMSTNELTRIAEGRKKLLSDKEAR